MIWFFVISSIVVALVGIVFLVAPEKMLFLVSDEEKQRLMDSSFYRVTARVGGVLLILVCAPLVVISGLMLVGLWTAF